MKNRIPRALICLVMMGACLACPSASAQDKPMIYANEHWPPWIIVDKDYGFSGIDIEILGEISRRMKLPATPIYCPWARCLEMLRQGRADISSTALRRPEREVYLHFITPPYLQVSVKCFYVRKGEANRIKTYADLAGRTVGTMMGSVYFAPFDNDPSINRVTVTRPEQLLDMLEKGYIDCFIGTELVIDYLLKEKGMVNRFDKSVYRHTDPTPFHFVISKNSPLAPRLPEFNRVLKQLMDEGVVDAIIRKYTQP